MNKIIILALSGIGDALMFTPSLKFLRDNLPNAQIDVLVMFKGVKDIYDRLNLATNVIYFDFMKEGAVNSLKFVFGLRGKYDASINVYPSNRKEYNVIAFLIGAKKRGNVKYLRMDNQELGFINNVRIKEDDKLHNVEENIRICEKLIDKTANEISPLLLRLNDSDKSFAENYIDKNNLSGKLLIGFHAGCSLLKNHIKRRWEPDKFIELAKSLIEEKNATVLLFGGPDENELKKYIYDGVASKNVIIVEVSNLTQSAALMTYCKIFVTNDSGLMHIASAMQVTTVSVIGPTSLNYIHPWKSKYHPATLNLECAPCFVYSPKSLHCTRKDIQFKCIKELTVDFVKDIIIKNI